MNVTDFRQIREQAQALHRGARKHYAPLLPAMPFLARQSIQNAMQFSLHRILRRKIEPTPEGYLGAFITEAGRCPDACAILDMPEFGPGPLLKALKRSLPGPLRGTYNHAVADVAEDEDKD